jgi:NADH-quinone oxidoreductase subunit I
MQAAETTDKKERYPESFEINMLRCIYCGFCEDVCPEEAIVMSAEYDFNFRHRHEAIYEKDRLLMDVADLKGRLTFLGKKRNPNFGGELYSFDESNNTHSVRNRK